MALHTNTSRARFGLKAAAAALTATAAMLSAPQTADAGLAPNTYLSVEIRDTGQNTLFDSGEVDLSSIGVGNMIAGYTYSDPQGNFPALQDSRYTMSGQVISRTESAFGGALPAQLFHNLSYVNDTNDTLEFIINLRMPMTSPSSDPAKWVADSGWNVVGANDPEVFSLDGMSLFSASVNGTQVATQGDNPSGFGGGGGQLFFDPLPMSGQFGAAANELSLKFAFSLSPGANLGIQGLVNVPSPAAAPLLAVGALVGSRRRRRN